MQILLKNQAIADNTQRFDVNQLKRHSLLIPISHITNIKSDTEFVANFEISNVHNDDKNESDLLSAYLTIGKRLRNTVCSAKKRENQTTAQKCIALPNEICDYIYIIPCY